MCVCTFACAYIHIHNRYTSIHTYIYTYVYTHVQMHTSTHVHIHIATRVCVCIYIYIAGIELPISCPELELFQGRGYYKEDTGQLGSVYDVGLWDFGGV